MKASLLHWPPQQAIQNTLTLTLLTWPELTSPMTTVSTSLILYYCFDVALISGVGIRFEQNTYLYLESAGTDMVCALLEGEADREIVVTFELTNGLAQGWLGGLSCNISPNHNSQTTKP